MRFPLLRALSGSAGAAAFRAITPLYAGIAVAASILFGPQGMSSADAVSALDSAPPLRLGLWGLWVAAAAPAARILFERSDTFYLRALPVARWRFWAIHTAHLAALELPWIVLHVRGGPWPAALAAAGSTAGAHSLVCARTLRWPQAGAACLLVVCTGWLRPLELAAGALAIGVGVPTAFARAPERGAGSRTRWVRGPAAVALAASYLVVLPRQAPAAIVRALAMTAGGAALTVLVARNNQLADPTSIAALSAGMSASFVTAGIGGVRRSVLASALATAWILDSTGASGGMRRVAAAGAIATTAAACGLFHGAVVAVALGAGPALAAGLSLAGAGAAAAASLLATAARRRHP